MEKGSISAIVGIIVALGIIGFGGWYYMQGHPQDLMSDAAPVDNNATLSSSDDTQAIQKDADDAYMMKLQADIDADLQAAK